MIFRRLNIFTFFDDARKQDLSSITAHYDALIEAESKASEQRQERIRELVSVEKSESKSRVDALLTGKAEAIARIEARYAAPQKQDEIGVVVTGSGYDAGNK